MSDEQKDAGRAFAESMDNMSGEQRPTTPKLAKLLDELADAVTFDYQSGGDGYSMAAGAMWKAALAAFEWAAGEVGATGFQASWAVMQFVAKANHIDGPFMLIKIEDALYPQYDLPGRVESFIAEQREWLRDEAKKKLAQPHDFAVAEVVQHWERLAAVS